MPRLELDQHVDITIIAKIIPQNRAKERELANVILATEMINLRLWDGYGYFSFHKHKYKNKIGKFNGIFSKNHKMKMFLP
ncbi:MAG: hypothetical protein ONB49_21195, partial [candidate division KSB1 bacterium]|nr:hypothetical protein [candidate division KSB1 bacterium]